MPITTIGSLTPNVLLFLHEWYRGTYDHECIRRLHDIEALSVLLAPYAWNPPVNDRFSHTKDLWCGGYLGGFLCCDFLNSFLPGQNGRPFADDVFKCIFLNEKFCISIKISPKFVPKSPIDNNPALVYTMAWCQIGAKPFSEQMRTRFTGAYMWHYGEMR